MNSDLELKLRDLAFKRSEPFCYSCYQVCPTGFCQTCGSDDLMRLTKNGCEYGVDWIIEEILSEELQSVDISEAFEESVRTSLEQETVKIGWMTFDAVTVMKEQDPISWSIAESEYVSSEESEGTLVSPDNGKTYYQTQDVESLVED